MKADVQIRMLLEDAAARIPVDTDRALAEMMRTSRRRRSRHALALVAAAAALLTIVVTQLPRAKEDRGFVQPGPGGRIAIGVRTAAGTRLFGVDLATGVRTELAPGLGSPTAAQWSPDGSKVAFTVEENGGARYALVVANTDGSHPVKLVEHDKAEGTLGPDFISVAWSPDGTRLAYSGRTIYRGRTVSVVMADGTGEWVLDGHWESVSWAPDGSHLLLDGWPDEGSEGRFDLYIVRPDGSDLTGLTDDALREFSASWSPDGSRIAFARTDVAEKAKPDIYVMNPDGTNVQRLTDGTSFSAVPVWSPDGNWIAFASDRDSTPEQQQAAPEGSVPTSIYIMRPDGSDLTLLLDRGNDVIFPLSWTSR